MTAQLSRLPEWFEYHASLARTHQTDVLPFKVPPPWLGLTKGKRIELHYKPTYRCRSINHPMESPPPNNHQKTRSRCRSRKLHNHQTLRKSPTQCPTSHLHTPSASRSSPRH